MLGSTITGAVAGTAPGAGGAELAGSKGVALGASVGSGMLGAPRKPLGGAGNPDAGRAAACDERAPVRVRFGDVAVLAGGVAAGASSPAARWALSWELSWPICVFTSPSERA